MPQSRTKRALVARLLKGPIAIERAFLIHWYRVSVPSDPDPLRCVLIALAPEYDYILEDYDSDHAYAHIDGDDIGLTRREADAIAARLRRTFRVGRRPLHRSSRASQRRPLDLSK